MTPVPRITCEICPGLLPPFFHPHIKVRARIAHGGGRRPGKEAKCAYARSVEACVVHECAYAHERVNLTALPFIDGSTSQ